VRTADRIPRRGRRAAGAFAGLYVLLVVFFAALSHRVVFGILIAVPVTACLALNYALLRSSWAQSLTRRSRTHLISACWAVQTTLIAFEVLNARRVPIWLAAPLALFLGALAATAYTRWPRHDTLSRESPRHDTRPPLPPTPQPLPPPRPAQPAEQAERAALALAASDARVLAESETAQLTRDDRSYAAAITNLQQLVTEHPTVPGGRFLLHAHRAQYLTFQAGLTSERLAHATPADRPRLEARMQRLYAETESELRSALAAPPGPNRTPSREQAALGLLLCLGAEQGGPNRTDEGIGLLREALLTTRDTRARIQLDLATALVIRHRLTDNPTDRHEAEALLKILTTPTSPVATEAHELKAELRAAKAPRPSSYSSQPRRE
jgi:hypothetical protein